MVESNASCVRKCNRHSVCNGAVTGTTTGTSSSSNLDTNKSPLTAAARRRRHKTVHFGDNLLLQVCANANLSSHRVSYTTTTATNKMEANVQQLFSFIETVLSAWVAEEGLTSQGEISETDEKGLERKRLKKQCAKVKRLNIRRLVAEVSKLDGTKLLGNLRYRHIHWKSKPDPEGCNELFLRKVFILFFYFKKILLIKNPFGGNKIFF